MLKTILLYCFVGIFVTYFGLKFGIFIARKVFGGRTAEERTEEKRLRKKQIEESIPQIIDSVSI
jgi:uncharacterized protein YneF (UPF0154 family)